MLHVRRANPISDCPLSAANAAVGGKWKMTIVYWLFVSPLHFAGLRAYMPGLSPKVLSEQLCELIDDDIVQREATGKIPAPVMYSLTAYGRTLETLVEATRLWGRGHIARFAAEGEPSASALPA
jgi:DNA-binding HxlR family transcriptional regulator